jgi:hypothetical protein
MSSADIMRIQFRAQNAEALGFSAMARTVYLSITSALNTTCVKKKPGLVVSP